LSYPKYLEDKIPRSGRPCTCGATYHNAMIGRAETPFADYAALLRRKGPQYYGLASSIEQHYGEQQNHVFFDFFPVRQTVMRFDDRTTAPMQGWKLDQDRRCQDGQFYDPWGYVA
jgi:hypothetical protein